jgi:hypothetical protein
MDLIFQVRGGSGQLSSPPFHLVQMTFVKRIDGVRRGGASAGGFLGYC